MIEPGTPEYGLAQAKTGNASIGQFGKGVIGAERAEEEQRILAEIEKVGVFGPGVTGRVAEVVEPTAVEKVVERLQHQNQHDPRSRAVNLPGPGVGGVPAPPVEQAPQPGVPDESSPTSHPDEAPAAPPKLHVLREEDDEGDGPTQRTPVANRGRRK